MWTTTNTKPLCFKSVPEGYKEKKNIIDTRKLPREVVDFLANRFAKTG